MKKLKRAKNTESAKEIYIASLAAKFRKDPVLRSFPKSTHTAYARQIIIRSWPKTIRKPSQDSKVWLYEVAGGDLTPELSGAIGGDLNLHVGSDATLATPGLIGISAAAIADDIGGTLLSVYPISYRQALYPGETVLIEITFLEEKRIFQYFQMTGQITGRDQKLFDKATIKMTGATIPP